MRATEQLFQDTYRDKIELSLDSKQVFYVFFGGAVLACLVFVLGVGVGRRVEAKSQAAGIATSDPLAALDRMADDPNLSFVKTLRTPRPMPTPLVASEDDHEADEDEAAQEADEARAKQAAKQAEAEKKAALAKKAAAKAAEKEPEESAKPAAAAAEPVEAAKKPAAAASGPDDPRAHYTLQLSSFQDRTEADALAAKLRKAGYSPYVRSAQVEDKGTWYRVRLGGYPDYDAALGAKADFEAKMHIIAYVTRIR